MKDITYLKRKLTEKQYRIDRRYAFYDMKHTTELFKAADRELGCAKSVLGWCGKAVDTLADRLSFKGFENDNLNLNGIFNMNNPDVLTDSAILGALITSCDFIYITKGSDGVPVLRVIDGRDATGEIDPRTNLLTCGYAILEKDEHNNVITDAYLEPNRTTVYKSDGTTEVFTHNVNHPLLVPIIHKPSAKRPFGHSVITRACMAGMDAAARTIQRSEIAAEFYAYPQKYVTGLAEDAELMEKWKATASSFLQFTKDEDGDKPVLGQFQAASMAPFTEQLKMIASEFAGECGLTLGDIMPDFNGGNPTSAEAITASHENLRLRATKAQASFGTGLLNAGYLAACLRDGITYDRSVLYETKPTWKPIFAPSPQAINQVADAIVKINTVLPGYIDTKKAEELLGF